MSMSRRRRADVDMVASNLERTCLVQGKREKERRRVREEGREGRKTGTREGGRGSDSAGG